MEQLFNDIQNHIAGHFPELSLVDEDYGQLEAIETAEDTYPVTFPCALISIPETEWENLGGGSQRGRASVTVRLAIDCYDDTHYGSGTSEKAAERKAFATSIHRQLQGFKSGTCSPLIRRKSSDYSRPHGIKVYETLYQCTVNDIV
ncbi:MAG: hypothetical protein LBK58_09015 [Prevotellaceae bacterium]|jgi:hypothetical protein|nr:hypothetical protein [Prevotellaceae bacterium]